MFDIGFSELFMFGVIALIVLGPEKLPQAARTAGQWYGKLRRTVSTLQSEIEAELDLAETRQQMQQELAKIRQTEANMKRQMDELRGSMREFEDSQNESLKTDSSSSTQPDTSDHQQEDFQHSAPKDFSYAYEKQAAAVNEQDIDSPLDDALATTALDDPTPAIVAPIITKPWENMWFKLGAYDKARRLPAAPYLPKYRADALLHHSNASDIDSTSRSIDKKTDHNATETLSNPPPSLDKQEGSNEAI